jgi:hypothetical protein
MQVIFKLEEKLAEIHLVPTSPLNKSQLQMIRQYSDRGVRITVGQENELIIIIDSVEKINAIDKETRT